MIKPTQDSERTIDVALGEPNADERIVAREREERLAQALRELPEPMREAVVLRFAEGLAYEDMATLLEASQTTLRSRVFHALRKLRELLAEGERSS